MGTSTRRCKHCDKAGAHTFNNMCNNCWNKQIDLNIQKVIEQNKKGSV